MEPSQRLFLETAIEAVEDAGYGGKSSMVLTQVCLLVEIMLNSQHISY